MNQIIFGQSLTKTRTTTTMEKKDYGNKKWNEMKWLESSPNDLSKSLSEWRKQRIKSAFKII